MVPAQQELLLLASAGCRILPAQQGPLLLEQPVLTSAGCRSTLAPQELLWLLERE